MPIIDLLELWSEAFEMKQEKAALYGEPHSQPNPYNPPQQQHNTTTPDSQYHGDQAAQKACRASGDPRVTDNPAISPKEEEIR